METSEQEKYCTFFKIIERFPGRLLSNLRQKNFCTETSDIVLLSIDGNIIV